MTEQTSIVTNVSDLTPAMRELLLRPVEPGLSAEVATRTNSIDALRHRGLVSMVSSNPPAYRLTEAGARARAALERESAPVVVNQALGSYGWTMLAENCFGGHSITTWTRDEHTLVLSWIGAYEVSAVIHDGFPLPLDKLIETITDGDGPSENALAGAARHAMLVTPARFASELSELLLALHENEHHLVSVRAAAQTLAVAILGSHARG
jgi:hypothetical protein